MISVLIPVYNSDVRNLVLTLQSQLLKAAIPFEILLLDDASNLPYLEQNRQLKGEANCVYEERAVNIGRLETRKELARKASYPWLLFIDSDCTVKNDQFINNYKLLLNNEFDVILGGTSYTNNKPANCSLQLHWKYSQQRISNYTNRLRQKPYHGFLFNNVLFKKALFNEMIFPDFFNGYGHEDTWVGIALEAKKAKLHFINNPVLHVHLDQSNLFLQKNIDALANIKYLQTFNERNILKQHIKIYRYHLFLKKARLSWVFNLSIAFFIRKIRNNLLGCNPSLFFFDLLRLYHLNKIM